MYIHLQKERKIMKRIEVYKLIGATKHIPVKKCVVDENFHSKNLSIVDALDFLAKLGDEFPYRIKISNGKVLY